VDVGVGVVPIVGSACLFDLACGRADVRPTASDGVAAVKAAFEEATEPLARGNVGAGTGCTVGKICGPQQAMKSGLGEGVAEAGALVCGAVAAVNAVGDVFDPATGAPLAGVRGEDGRLMADTCDALLALQEDLDFARRHGGGDSASGAVPPAEARANTTISCVVTNAKLSKAEATKVAQMAADAYAHAIRPVHTTNDGDTIFVLATGECEAPVDVVGVLATRALEAALVDAARSATTAYGYPAAGELITACAKTTEGFCPSQKQ
jgi:L-aminopeptidase/D-esterase-like protein